MTKIKIPKIPKGNLDRVYVLSEPAAEELFRECSSIVKECWNLSDNYEVPNVGKAGITLEVYPHLRFPQENHKVGRGAFGLITNPHLISESLFQFICEAQYEDRDGIKPYEMIEYKRVTPGTHIFVYDLFRGREINTSFNYAWKKIDHDVASELKSKAKSNLDEIAKKIEGAIQRRSAVLKRGWLSNQFVM